MTSDYKLGYALATLVKIQTLLALDNITALELARVNELVSKSITLIKETPYVIVTEYE